MSKFRLHARLIAFPNLILNTLVSSPFGWPASTLSKCYNSGVSVLVLINLIRHTTGINTTDALGNRSVKKEFHSTGSY